MNKLVCYFILTTFFSCALAQEVPISSPANSCLFYQTDSNGRIFRNDFENLLDDEQINILERTIIDQVNDLNFYLGKLWESWTDVKRLEMYSSEEDFYDEKKEYAKKALELFIYDGNKGIENILNLYRAYPDANGSYYRWKKKPGMNDGYYKVPALHVGRDENGELRDSVYEDITIPAAKIWVTNKYSSRKTSLTVKQYLNNLQTTSKIRRDGRISFNGGDYCFTPNLIWNRSKNRYEGSIECWQEQSYKNQEGTLYTVKNLIRITIYIPIIEVVIDGRTYIYWVIKFGNIKVLETSSL